MKEKTFMNLEEIANYLNEKPGTIRDWVAKKRIPYYKRGRRLQFKLEEIKAWDEENYHFPIAELSARHI